MTGLSSLVRGTAWSSLGTASAMASQLTMLVTLSQLGTTTMVGQYGIAMAMVSPVFALTNMQLRGLQSTDSKGQFEFRDYLSLRLATTTLALLIVIAIVIATDIDSTTATVALTLGFRLSLTSITDTFLGLLQRHEKQDKISQATMVGSVLGVLGFVTGFITTGSLITAGVLSSVGLIFPLTFQLLPASNSLMSTRRAEGGVIPHWDFQVLRALALQALPLGIISLVITLHNNLPRYFLSAVSTEAVGVFVALTTLLVVIAQVYSTLSQVVSPRLANLYAQGNKNDFIRLLLICEILAAIVLVVGIVLGRVVGAQIASLVFGSEYGQYPVALTWLAATAGLAFMGGFVGVVATIIRKLYVQVFNGVLSLLVLTLGCWLLVPSQGITGAAGALAIAALSQLVLNGIVCIRFIHNWSPDTGSPALTQLGTS